MPQTSDVFLLCAFLSIVTSSDEVYQITDCQPKICRPGNYSIENELKAVTSLVIRAKSKSMDDYESTVAVSVDVGETPSYLSHDLETSDETNSYFHVNSGLWISQFPLLGNGMLQSISLNISHGGVIQVYSMSMYDKCNRFNMFWRCLNNSVILGQDWGEEVSSAVDELEYFSAGLLEDTYFIVNSLNVSLRNTGDQNEVTDFLVQKGHYIGFESINATLICNSLAPINTIEYANYETPAQSTLAPFFTLHFQYKTYQPYELHFIDMVRPSSDYESVDISKHFTLDVTDGTLSIERSLVGYFSSYVMIFEIPHWDMLYNDHDHDVVSFDLLAIIDGALVGMPNTSRSLNNIIDMPPPAKIDLPKSVITHPDKTFQAVLSSENENSLFLSSIENYRWTLSVLPSNTIISYSSKSKFNYNDLVMPGNYRLTLEFDTKDNITFKTYADIEYVSDAFTFIKCLLNCDSSCTTGHANLHLSADVSILSKLNFEILSAKWSVIERDTQKFITDDVTLFDDLIEISVKTSILTKKSYLVNLVILTLERNITIHDDYNFNMSYPLYNLDCSVNPKLGISLNTAHTILCNLAIDNIMCSLCENSESTLCSLCRLEYIYSFKFCLDHGDCKIQLPLIMGNLSEPLAIGIHLPVGNELDDFNLETVVCMYDEKGNVEYAHEHASVTSKPDPLLDVGNILKEASTANMDKRTNKDVFEIVQKVGIAVSHGQLNETIQKQIVEALKTIKLEHNDISMLMFSVLYPMSQMKGYDGITVDLSSLTNITYQSIQNPPKEVAKSASNAMLSIMWNLVESNVEISNVQVDLPEMNFYFITESPDKAYYNKWVDFDIDEESQLNKDSARSSAICSTLQTLQDYASQYLKKGAALGESSTLSLPNLEYSLGKVTAKMLLSGNQLVGENFIKVPPPEFIDVSFVDALSISFVKFSSNPCILTANSDRIKSAVIGINITDSVQNTIVVKGFEKPVEAIIPLKARKTLQEFLYHPDYNWLYLQLEIFAKPHSVLFLQLTTTRATTLLLKYRSLPKILDHDLKFEFPNVTADKSVDSKLSELEFPPSENSIEKTIQVPLKHNGTYFIGVRVGGNRMRRFWLLPYMTSCLKWTGEGWSVSSNNVGILSNSTSTHCKFHELSLYAADLSYPNLTEYKRSAPEKESSRVFEYLKIWIPLLVVYGYLLSTVTYVLKLHERDLNSTNLLHLLSSNKTEHSYKIDIKTGLRPNAGTTSQVYLELYGSRATKKIKIEQNNGELFETNQTSSFLFYSDINVGRIDKINIWIDYSGSHPDWFLESVRIRNSKDRVFMFIYHNWIGFDIERYACSIPRYRPSDFSLVKRLMICFCECLVNYHSGFSNLLKGTRIFPSRIYLTSLFVFRCLSLLCLVVVCFENSVQDLIISPSGFLKLVFLLLSTYPVFFLLEKWQEILNKNERYNFLVKNMMNKHDSRTSLFDLDEYFRVTANEKSSKEDGKANSERSSHDELDQNLRLTAKTSEKLSKKGEKTNFVPSAHDELDEYFRLTAKTSQKVSEKDEKKIFVPSSTSHNELEEYFKLTGKTSGKMSKKGEKTNSVPPSRDGLQEYCRLTSKVTYEDLAVKDGLKDDIQAKHSDEAILVLDDSENYGDVKVDDYFRFFWDESSSVSSRRQMPSPNCDTPFKKLDIPIMTFKFSSKLLSKLLVVFSYMGILTTTCFYLFYTYSNKSIQLNVCLMYYLIIMGLVILVEQPVVCGVIMLIYSNRLWYGTHTTDSHCDTVLNTGGANLSKLPEIKTWYHTVSKRRKMNSVIMKLFSYIAFILIVVFLSKQDRQTNCYYLNTSVRKVFATAAFDSIETKADFWNWIQNDFSSALSSEDFFEGTRVRVPKEKYLRDSSSIIISISRLKQVRIKPTSCKNNKEEMCNEGYRSSLIENKNFDPGWKKHTPAEADARFSTIRYKSYWEYHDGEDGVSVRGHAGVYPAGGYKAPLANSPLNARKQLQMLQKDEWIDALTRAVFVELSVYNPPTGFLCTVKLITEFLPTGNAISYAQLHSINFLKYSQPINLSNIRTELVYLISLVILTAHYIHCMHIAHSKGHSVWRGFWTVLDSVTLLAGWTSVGMYIYRYKYIHAAIVQFQDTPYYYIDFHRAAAVDVYFGYCLGALVFLVTVKIVDLTIAHVKIKLMTLIIHNSLVELSTFGVPAFIFVAGFAQTFYCLYGSSMLEYSKISSSFGQTIAFILGENDWEAMMRVRPYLTPFLGLLLGFLSITYLANIFAVIVCYNTTNLRMNPPSSGHLAIFGYLIKSIKNFIFFIVPLFEDVYTMIEKNLPGRDRKFKNPYYKEVSSTDSSSAPSCAPEKDVLSLPSTVKSVGALDQDQSKSIGEMRSKLKCQTRTLKELNDLLNCLEKRLEKFPGC